MDPRFLLVTNGMMNGLLVLDKPSGITSRDAVDLAQRWFPRSTKIGHTGTLDPRATGVLVLCIGAATRLSEYVQDLPKMYRTTIFLGGRSDTDDADGTISPGPNRKPVAVAEIHRASGHFQGEIEQIPPAYSAALVAGKRAYALARKGRDVVLTPRRVRVDRIHICEYVWPELTLEIECGKGTYIRSIARDLGEALGCGGYVGELRRERVGPFTPVDAVSLQAEAEQAHAHLLPMSLAVAHLPTINLDATSLQRFRFGQQLPWKSEATVGQEFAIFGLPGGFAGVAKLTDTGKLRPYITLK